MDIYTLRDNLKNTIDGKERYHENLVNEYLLRQHDADPMDHAATGINMADKAAMKFLDINIKELKSILADVEVCCQQSDRDKQQLNDYSWATNPDRMGQ
jgi:hypothetical protein